MPTTSPLGLRTIHVRPSHPDFLDLPWHQPLSGWDSPRLVEVERGLSRHEVRFVSYPEGVYAIKELPAEGGEREYDLLRGLERRRLPAVLAVGHAVLRAAGGEGGVSSVLITRFLEESVPYRTLFMNPGLERYRERLLDAIAGLIVRLHLAGFYWGDCSLSNALFRRDAGELQACLVDAETSRFADTMSDAERRQDLHIMMENVAAELADLSARFELPSGLGIHETGASIRERYERLWDEITREETLALDEGYRIHERIRALNELGFSVGEVELVPVAEGSALRVRTLVTDRLYHHHLLHSLTGIVARDRQAALMINEIREMRALLSRERGRDVPMSEAAHRWLHERFLPASQRLQSLVRDDVDVAELYCQVLEHKWLVSESARHDVGFERALEDYLARARGTEPVA